MSVMTLIRVRLHLHGLVSVIKLTGFKTEFATINVTNMSIAFKKGACFTEVPVRIKLKTFLEMSDSV